MSKTNFDGLKPIKIKSKEISTATDPFLHTISDCAKNIENQPHVND